MRQGAGGPSTGSGPIQSAEAAEVSELRISVAAGIAVSAIAQRPPGAFAGYVFAHGAGAGMRHRFMESLAERLAVRGVATLRYQFPYTEAGRSRPDAQPLLLSTVRSAIEAGTKALPGLPLLAGGKSMGGRMTSLAASEAALAGVRGLAFFGFPLHQPGKPGTERAEHLTRVDLPMLFFQGTRDALASLDLLRPICADLGPRATLHEVDGADHGFHVLKRSGRTDDDVLNDLADTFVRWAAPLAR